MTLGEVAGWTALAAAVTLVISGVALALFFGGAGDYWGPINDLFVAATLVLLLPTILATWRLSPDDTGPWFALLCLAAIAGALLAAVGQVLLVVGVIDLHTSFLTGGIGVLPIVAWAIGLAVLIFTRDMLGVTVGWLLVAALGVATLGTLASFVAPWWLTAAVSTLLLVLLTAWLVNLSGEIRVAF